MNFPEQKDNEKKISLDRFKKVEYTHKVIDELSKAKATGRMIIDFKEGAIMCGSIPF